MAKEKLIPWLIRHCDEKTFVGMGWVSREKGTLFLDWTRQGNTGWKESDAARAWAEMKGHVKNKQPRDLKAGFRNAFRSKEKELVKVHIPKNIAERDGRKRMIWRFLDLKSELRKISNPPSKCKRVKKSTSTKSRQDMDDMIFENDPPSCSSTQSDFEYVFPKPEESQAKIKIPRKKGTSTKYASKKQSMNTSNPLPPIQTFILTYSCKETMCTPPLQHQDISSTFTEDRFPENVTDNVFVTSQQLYSSPTPPPQKTDIMYKDSDEMSQIIKSDNHFRYYTCQSSHFPNQSDEDRQSPHSSSSLWNIPMHNKFQNRQVPSQSDESSHPCSPLLHISSPNHFQDTQVFNQSDGNMNIPHSRLYSSNQSQFQFAQPDQFSKNCDATPSNAQPCIFPSHDQLQDSVPQSQQISDEQMCDSLQRVTSPSLYSNVTFPDLITQYLPPGSENHSLFPDFTLRESSQPKEGSSVEWDFEAPIDDEENFLNLSELITSDFNLL